MASQVLLELFWTRLPIHQPGVRGVLWFLLGLGRGGGEGVRWGPRFTHLWRSTSGWSSTLASGVPPTSTMGRPSGGLALAPRLVALLCDGVGALSLLIRPPDRDCALSDVVRFLVCPPDQDCALSGVVWRPWGGPVEGQHQAAVLLNL